MSKETQARITNLRGKVGKIDASIEKVKDALEYISPASFVRRTDDLSLLDRSHPEDNIYAIRRVGETRKKIVDVTIPVLGQTRGKLDVELQATVRDYRLSESEENINALNELKEQGYISEEELQNARDNHAAIREELTRTAEEKKQNREQSSSKERETSTIVVNEAENELVVNGRTIKFRKDNKDLRVFINILKRKGKRTLTSQLSKVAETVGLSGPHPVGNAMAHMKKRIESDPKNPKIIKSFGGGRKAGYKINASVEFVGDDREKSPKKPEVKNSKEIKKADKKGLPELIESRVEALRLFISKSDLTVEEVIDVLGPSDKMNRKLTWVQSAWALGRAMNLLYARIKANQATKEERSMWQEIRKITRRKSQKDVRETFIESINTWFRENKEGPITEAEEEEIKQFQDHDVESLSKVELAILANGLIGISPALVKIGLAPFDMDLRNALFHAAKDEISTIHIDDLAKRRKDIFEKAEHLIESDALYELIDLETPEALELYNYLTSGNQKQLLEFLKAAFSGANLDQLIHEHNLEKKEPQVAPEKSIKSESVPSIERHDPEVRTKIKGILDEIDEKGIVRPISGALIVKYFPILKARTVDNAVDNHYISPQKGKGKGHYALSPFDITVLLYTYRNASLSSSDRKSLSKVIKEEIVKRETKKKN